MVRSKYYGKVFDKGWHCTRVNIINVQSTKAKWPAHRTYSYTFERPTSDSKAVKIIQLSSSDAAKVYRGERTVESFAEKRSYLKTKTYTGRVTYNFN